MAVLKCKMCGGELDVISGSTVCMCEYCGTKQTVPTFDDEQKLTLFARADMLRYNCEFDKAYANYESIINKFPDEAEAYWGLILCKYGIQYVDDPKTGRKIPTCHRSSFESILDDESFDLVLENADTVSRAVYKEQAREIEAIREKIIELSSKEKPYDIFICYKETDKNGERTIDSVIAQDVYEALISKGYKVFFARITLESKLGQEYEPYIFSALNSAKVMLVFGTDYEHYNAVWVKNEWSRFLKLMAKDNEKVLIPCYRGIDAYDMPKEFRKLQAQDMGKVGAIQDLLHGLEKIIVVQSPVASVQDGRAMATFKIQNLQKRADLALAERNFKRAEEFFDNMLSEDIEYGGAYLGLDMARCQCVSVSELALYYAFESVEFSSDLKMAKKYSEGASWISEFDSIYKIESEKIKEEKRIAEEKRRREEEERRRREEEERKRRIEEEKRRREEEERKRRIEEERRRREEEERKKAEEERRRREEERRRAEEEARRRAEEERRRREEEARRKAEEEARRRAEEEARRQAEAERARKQAEEEERIRRELAKYEIGGKHKIGAYKSSSLIEWTVIDKEKDYLLLLSDKIICQKEYHTDFKKISWEQSSIRQWLNGEFYSTAFTQNEKSKILLVDVYNPNNPEFKTKGGNPTEDRIFLLSADEADELLTSDKRSGMGYYGWWLRTPGDIRHYASHVTSNGEIDLRGNSVCLTRGVRPAMWIRK